MVDVQRLCRTRALSILVIGFAIFAGCTSRDAAPAPVDFSDVGLDATPRDSGEGIDGRATDASVDSGAAPRDSGLDARVDASDGGDLDADAGADLGPALDAPVADGKPTSDGSSAVCSSELAWWAKDATFDGTVTPSTFAAQVNPLLSGGHPVTIADQSTAGWTLQISATITGSDFAQHFPVDHAPSAMVPMLRTVGGFSTGAAEGSAFLYVRDAAPSDVWIPISDVTTTATYDDPTLCQGLSSATLDAIIPTSAGPSSITTASGATTLHALLGPPTSSSPPGWNVRLLFAGEKVAVSFK